METTSPMASKSWQPSHEPPRQAGGPPSWAQLARRKWAHGKGRPWPQEQLPKSDGTRWPVKDLPWNSFRYWEDAIHERSKRNFWLSLIGWSSRWNADNKLIIRRKKVRPWGVNFQACWRLPMIFQHFSHTVLFGRPGIQQGNDALKLVPWNTSLKGKWIQLNTKHY